MTQPRYPSGVRLFLGTSAISIAALACAAIAALACAATPALAQGKPAPDPARIEEARRHMKAGAAFYNDPSGHKCEEALVEFRKAYDLSGSLNALKGMAVCNLELERDADAIEEYAGYLAGKGASLDAEEKAQVEADLNALKQAVATVTLRVDVDGVRVADVRTPARGLPVRNGYTLARGATRLGIHPGEHVLTASLEGRADQVWKVSLVNGGSFSRAFVFGGAPAPISPTAEVPPVSPPGGTTRPVPAYVWVGGGVTLALAVPWIALAVRAKSKNDDYNAVNGKEPAAELDELQSAVKSANLVADVFLGLTAASLTTTLVLFLTRPSKPAQASRARSWAISPVVGASRGGAVMEGWF
jgi:hypothetical protein